MPTPARLVLGLGLLLLVLGVVNAGLASGTTPELQRAEVLDALAAVILMLVAVLWTRAEPSSAKATSLEGDQGLEIAEHLLDPQREELAWGSHMLLTATPGATVLVHWNDATILRRGLLGKGGFQPGAISARSMQRQSSVSLVNTALFPGRAEFDSVLEDLPSVFICPLGTDGVVVVGGWAPRCFSRSDERWIEGWCQRLRTSLEQNA